MHAPNAKKITSNLIPIGLGTELVIASFNIKTLELHTDISLALNSTLDDKRRALDVRLVQIFETGVAVQPVDIDGQNHVNNIVYLRWVQEVATAHWESLASAESQESIGWVVLRHEIDYKAPASLDDQILLRTWVGKASRLTFERFTEIRRRSDKQLLAQARTLWVPIDVRTGKPTRVSSELRAQFST